MASLSNIDSTVPSTTTPSLPATLCKELALAAQLAPSQMNLTLLCVLEGIYLIQMSISVCRVRCRSFRCRVLACREQELARDPG
jgi:hypothetical protein